MNSTDRPQIPHSVLKAAAGVAALVAIAFGASAIASGSKSNTASFAGGPPGAPGAAAQGGSGSGQMPGPPGTSGSGSGSGSGQMPAPPSGVPGGSGPPSGAPPAGAPGMGTAVTGATAAKVKAAALAKYPGTIERIDQAPDGNYVAHVIRSNGTEVHVIVSKSFEVTGTFAGLPRGAAPRQQAPSASNGSTT